AHAARRHARYRPVRGRRDLRSSRARPPPDRRPYRPVHAAAGDGTRPYHADLVGERAARPIALVTAAPDRRGAARFPRRSALCLARLLAALQVDAGAAAARLSAL